MSQVSDVQPPAPPQTDELVLALRAVHDAMRAVLESDDARVAVCRAACDLAEAPLCLLLERDGDELVLTGQVGATLPPVRVALHAEGASTLRRAVEAGEPVWVDDTQGSPLILPIPRELADARSALVHPMVDGHGVRGLLSVVWRSRRSPLSEPRREATAMLADQAVLALDRIDLIASLHHQARTDPLTGVANRLVLDEELPLALARARRAGEPLAVLALDLNGFKRVNDDHGHAAGDALLRQAASRWRAALRTTDLLARVGGDEFVAVLPSCSPAAARLIAERLRTGLEHAAGCAIGVAGWDREEAGDALLRRADTDLYADKARRTVSVVADPARVAAVRAALDRSGSGVDRLNDIAASVAEALAVPIAFVSLVDADALNVVGHHGLGYEPFAQPVAPVEMSVCRYAVTTGEPLVVRRAADHPLARGNAQLDELGAQAYLGVPFFDAAGLALGAVCAVDRREHPWSPADVRVLTDAARKATAALSDPG